MRSKNNALAWRCWRVCVCGASVYFVQQNWRSERHDVYYFSRQRDTRARRAPEIIKNNNVIRVRKAADVSRARSDVILLACNYAE